MECRNGTAGCLDWAVMEAGTEAVFDDFWTPLRIAETHARSLGAAGDLTAGDELLSQAIKGSREATVRRRGVAAWPLRSAFDSPNRSRFGAGDPALSPLFPPAEFIAKEAPVIAGAECCVERIGVTVSTPDVGNPKRGAFAGGSTVKWDVVIEVEMSQAGDCECECCEVKYYTAFSTTTSSPGGGKSRRTSLDVLPERVRARLRPAGDDAEYPTADNIIETPYRIYWDHPTTVRSPFGVYIRRSVGPQGFIGYIEDIGYQLDPARKALAIKVATDAARLEKPPRPPPDAIQFDHVGVYDHPVHWLERVNDPSEQERNPHLKKLFEQLKHGQYWKLLEGVDPGGTGSTSMHHKLTKTESECKHTITDAPEIRAMPGDHIAMERWYLVTIAPRGTCTGESVEKELVLSVVIIGGDPAVTDENYDVSPVRRI